MQTEIVAMQDIPSFGGNTGDERCDSSTQCAERSRAPGFAGPTLRERMKKAFSPFRPLPSEPRHEVVIMYFGRAGEFLGMTSERMAIPDGGITFGQLLERLRERSKRWAYELDGRYVLCAADGRDVAASDPVRPGMEIVIDSSKSIFEP